MGIAWKKAESTTIHRLYMKINSHCTRHTVSPVPVYGCIHRIGISAMCNLFCLIGMVSYSFDGRVFFEDFNKGVYIGRIIL